MTERAQSSREERTPGQPVHEGHDAGPEHAGASGQAADSAIRRMAGAGLSSVKRALAIARTIELVLTGQRDGNALTDQVFFTINPELKGTKLGPGTPEAREWLLLRDEVVHPALAAAPRTGGHEATHAPAEPTPAAPTPAAHAPAAPTPAAPAPVAHAPAAPTPAAAGPATPQVAAGKDAYLTQNDNTYNDTAAQKEWAENGARDGTCNMTSLAMALISLSGGDEAKVRSAALAKLHSVPPRAGAHLRLGGAGGRDMPLAKVLADSSLSGQVELADLLIAIAVEKYGYVFAMTSAAHIAEIAQFIGLAHGVKAPGGGQSLGSPKVRALAKERLAKGEKMIIATPGHYLFLTEVHEDGIVAHDPCGARLGADKHAPHFMYSGAVAQHALSHWLPPLKNPALREIALRRTSTNPAALAMVQRLIALTTLPEHERADEEKKIRAMSDHVEMGASNFYGAEDFAAWDLSICVDLAAGDGKTPPNA